MGKIKLEDLCRSFVEYNNFSCEPDCELYEEGKIFDKDKSVEWNKKEVERRNHFYYEEKEKLEQEFMRRSVEFDNLAVAYIAQEMNCSTERAENIYCYLSINCLRIYGSQIPYEIKRFLNLFRD